MFEKMASYLTWGMVNSGSISTEDEEIYVYGWSLLISLTFNLVVMFIIGILTKQVVGTIVFLFTFIFLRIFAGGYHADSYRGCFFLTISLYLIALLSQVFIPSQWISPAIIVALAISTLITFIWAPVDHPNKRYNEGTKAKNKKISCVIDSALSIIIILLLIWQPQLSPYLLWASLGIFTTSITLMYVIIKPYEEGGNFNEESVKEII